MALVLCFVALACASEQPAQDEDAAAGPTPTGGDVENADVEPVTLTAVTAFPEGTIFNDGFEILQEVLDEKTGGAITIEYLGGPETIAEFEMFTALKDGVVDLLHIPGAFYVPALPIVEARTLSPMTPWEERESGVYDFWQEKHAEQGVQYLGKLWSGSPFVLYLNEKIERPDLSGISVRVTPVYEPFVKALGGSSVTTAPGEVFTALERGTVDGYGWPTIGITQFGWEEVTNYRVDHGFYQTDASALMNLATWEQMDPALQDSFTEVMEEVERRQVEHYQSLEAEELEAITDAGVEIITLPDDLAEEYVNTAYDAAWEAVLKNAPEEGEQLRSLYGSE